MDSSTGLPGDAPPSIKEIASRAEAFYFNVNIPFKYWIQSCKTLRQEVSGLPARNPPLPQKGKIKQPEA